MRMFASTAILCTFLTSQALSNPLPKPQALPAPFLPTISQLQKIPIHFQQSLLNLLNHKSNLLGHNNKNPTTVAYNGRPTTLRPNKRPRPSSQQQHQQDLNLLFQYQPEEGGKNPKIPKKRPTNPLGGLPSLSGQLVSVHTTSSVLENNNTVESSANADDADGLFREDVLLGRPLHDKKINTLRNRI